ncbi:MAG: enoyl-CoA hydratase [Halioglobus sp.]|jgi:enoyl-CoA hydratase
MPVELTINGHIAEIVLNNPDKRNVLDCVFSAQLAQRVAEAESRPDVSCIVVAAIGRAFCAGGSLDELMRAQAGESGLLNEIYAGFLAVANSPLPTIAAVQGAAVGAGMNLALACDIRIVTSHAKFDTRFMQLGIHCGGGHSWMLQKYLNWEDSVAALVFGQVISGEQALAKGLATQCVEEADLLPVCREFAAGLAGVPRDLVEETKRSLGKSRAEANHQRMIEHEFEVQTHSLQQDHAKSKLEGFSKKISGAKN